jgi:hypothetical protein
MQISDYMKAIVLPKVPDDFTVADSFRHGLTDDVLRSEIEAFRLFLCKLYDRLAKEKADSQIIHEYAVVLFNIGLHGKLISRKKMIVYSKDLNAPSSPKNEKYNSFINITNERKAEIINTLSELGFSFSGDFSNDLDVTHENAVFGLKLLSQSQTESSKKASFYNLQGVFMRCDYYSLTDARVKLKELSFNLFLNPNPPEIKRWIENMNKFLCANGCSSDYAVGNAGITFTYTSRKNRFNKVCKIYIGHDGCKAYPYGRNFQYENNILPHLPEHMLDAMSDGSNECTGCASRNPDWCGHGGGFKHTHKEKSFRRCRLHGYGFSLENKTERDLIEKWLEIEVTAACM